MAIAKNNSYMRGHFNNSRVSKETNDFSHLRTSDFMHWDSKKKKYVLQKVDTSMQPQKTEDYVNLIDFLRDIKDREYTCSGLNSFERELLIIDCDDQDYGEKTRQLLTKYGIQWDYQKIKSSNGHSQTGIFLSEKVYLYDCKWDYRYHCLVENHHEAEHEKYKRVYNYLNFIGNGDLMYTGYNCQNPMFESEKTHTVWNKDVEHHTIDWWDQKLSSIVSSEEFLEAHKAAYASKKKPIRKRVERALAEIEETVVQMKDESDQDFAERKRAETAKALMLAEKIGDKSINYAILQEVQRTLKYCLDNHLTFSCETATRHVAYMYDESIRKYTYYLKIGDEEKAKAVNMFEGYQKQEAVKRAQTDYWQLAQGRLKKTDLSKIGYNIIQRDLSQTVRQVAKYIKYFRLEKLKHDNPTVSERKLAEMYISTFKEPMSKTTVRNCAAMTIPEELLLPNKWQPLLCWNPATTRKYYELENALVDARNALLGGRLEHVDRDFTPTYDGEHWTMHDTDTNIGTISYTETPKYKYNKQFIEHHSELVGNSPAIGVVLSDDLSPSQSVNDSFSITFQYFYNNSLFILSSCNSLIALMSYNNKLTSTKVAFHILE